MGTACVNGYQITPDNWESLIQKQVVQLPKASNPSEFIKVHSNYQSDDLSDFFNNLIFDDMKMFSHDYTMRVESNPKVRAHNGGRSVKLDIISACNFIDYIIDPIHFSCLFT